jgi:hypothetical protein
VGTISIRGQDRISSKWWSYLGILGSWDANSILSFKAGRWRRIPFLPPSSRRRKSLEKRDNVLFQG